MKRSCYWDQAQNDADARRALYELMANRPPSQKTEG